MCDPFYKRDPNLFVKKIFLVLPAELGV